MGSPVADGVADDDAAPELAGGSLAVGVPDVGTVGVADAAVDSCAEASVIS